MMGLRKRDEFTLIDFMIVIIITFGIFVAVLRWG
jgi:hypothetical protein